MRIKKLFRATSFTVVALSIACLLPDRAAAWGARGHQIIALVASERLSNNARQSIAELLGPDDSLESVADWADLMKLRRRDTASWHSVEISINVGDYNQERDCRRGVCIIEAIEKQVAILKNRKNPDNERADALKFLVHLIGDLHQPFHVSTNDKPDDNGALRVKVNSRYGAKSLHAVWDNDLVDYGLRRSGLPLTLYAGNLEERKSQRGYVAQGSVTDWALETHRLAMPAYMLGKDFMVADERVWSLDESYFTQNLPVVENQLLQAGVRLAKTLNDIFG